MARDIDTGVRMQTRPQFISVNASYLSHLEETMNELSSHGWNAMGFPQHAKHIGFFIMMTKYRDIPVPLKPILTTQFVDNGPSGE